MSSATYLNELKLSKYVDIFDDWGAENPDSIEDMDVDALIAEFDMKKGHAKLLRKWLDKRAGDDPPHSHSRTASIVSARGANVWDFFLSHYQAESGDLVALVATKLEHRGFRIWYDKWPGKGDAASGFIDVTKDGMKLGVERSAVFVLFLSKGVFTRPFCRLEIITALKERRPIITLMETDTRRGAFDFGAAAKAGVPVGFHPIIDQITSGYMAIPLRRDVEEQELMLDRISRIFLEGRAKVLVVADAVIEAAVAADEPGLPSPSSPVGAAAARTAPAPVALSPQGGRSSATAAAHLGVQSAFLSLRFAGPGNAQAEALEIRNALVARGIDVTPRLDADHVPDRFKEISNCINTCDVFVVFGKAEYGEDTGCNMSSYSECTYASRKKKKFAVINLTGCGGGLAINESAIENIIGGEIYHAWSDGVPAIVDWIISLIPGAGGASPSSLSSARGGMDVARADRVLKKAERLEQLLRTRQEGQAEIFLAENE